MAEEKLRGHVAARGGVGLAVDAQHELVTRTHAVALLDSDGGIRRVLVEMDFDMPLPVADEILAQLRFTQAEDAGTQQVPPSVPAHRDHEQQPRADGRGGELQRRALKLPAQQPRGDAQAQCQREERAAQPELRHQHEARDQRAPHRAEGVPCQQPSHAAPQLRPALRQFANPQRQHRAKQARRNTQHHERHRSGEELVEGEARFCPRDAGLHPAIEVHPLLHARDEQAEPHRRAEQQNRCRRLACPTPRARRGHHRAAQSDAEDERHQHNRERLERRTEEQHERTGGEDFEAHRDGAGEGDEGEGQGRVISDE